MSQQRGSRVICDVLLLRLSPNDQTIWLQLSKGNCNFLRFIQTVQSIIQKGQLLLQIITIQEQSIIRTRSSELSAGRSPADDKETKLHEKKSYFAAFAIPTSPRPTQTKQACPLGFHPGQLSCVWQRGRWSAMLRRNPARVIGLAPHTTLGLDLFPIRLSFWRFFSPQAGCLGERVVE